MSVAYEKLVQHLDERSLDYQTNSDRQSIWMDFATDVAAYRVIAEVSEDVDLFHVAGYSPLRIPPGARPAIAETIARANSGLCSGKFELDFDTGGLRFQLSQILTGGGLEDEIIERMISQTLRMLDTYLPAVLSVVYGNEAPADAIRYVEPPPSDEPSADPPEDLPF